MEVTLRLIVAFVLLGIMALLAGSMAIDQSEDVNEVSDSQTSYAECQLWKSRSNTLNNAQEDRWETKYNQNCDQSSSSEDQGLRARNE